MTEHDLELTLHDLAEIHVRPEAPADVREDARLVPLTAPGQRSWMPSFPKWRFQSMFSATKLIAAAAIVALFGGFLLMGIVTTQQDDETAPAAGTESPSPVTTEELLSGMVTEEVEPGVYRILHDGVRDLRVTLDTDGNIFPPYEAIRVSPDGGLWAFGGHWDTIFRLGEPEGYPWPEGAPLEDLHDRHPVGGTDDIEVAPDGTVWMADATTSTVYSLDGTEWTAWPLPPGHGALNIEVLADGTVWASPTLRLGDGGWETVDSPGCSALQKMRASDTDIYVDGGPGGSTDCDGTLYRFDGTDWQEVATPEGYLSRGGFWGASPVGADGTLWVDYRRGPEAELVGGDYRRGIARFDGIRWEEWDVNAFDGEEVTREGRSFIGDFNFEEIAPDGSLWGSVGECDGIGHFDGTNVTRYLARHCTHSPDVAPDGSLWLVAAGPTSNYGQSGPSSLYVITPEAVAAKETEAIEPPSVKEPTDTREAPTTTDDLLSGMVTEEVEPGVFRVLDDGAGHPLGAEDVTNLGRPYIDPSGAVWVVAAVSDASNNVMWQLGVPGRHEQGPGGDFPGPIDFATAPDGTLWVAGYSSLASYDGDSWTQLRVAKEPGDEWTPWAVAVEVLPDGTVWAAWEDRLGRLDAEGWHYYHPTMEEDDSLSGLHVLPDGSILAITWHGRMLRFDGAAWQEIPMPDVDAATRVTGVRVGFDGTLWMHFISRSTAPGRFDGGWWGSRWWDSDEVPQDHLAHYDGETWTTYSAADGLPRLTHALKPEPSWDVHPDGSVWVLADPEQAMESNPYSLLWTLRSFDGDTWTEWADGVGMLHATAISIDGDTRTEWTEGMGMLDIGPDGTVWTGRPDPSDPERLHLASFDGTTWRQYPLFADPDAWIGELAIAPDGSAWVVADADHSLYVIRP